MSRSLSARAHRARSTDLSRRALFAATLAATAWLWPASASAHHIFVLNTNDASAGSLRQAVLDSSPGDSIVFDPAIWGGAITLTSAPIAIAHNLAITGPQRRLLTIATSTGSGAFELTAGQLSLANLTVENPDPVGSTPGGLIHASDPSTQLQATDCDLVRGYDTGPGGLINTVGTTTLLRCRLSRGVCSGSVGGAVFSQGSLTATDCLFDSCSADSGGAIVSAGKLRLVRSTLTGNVGAGAALQLWNGADSTSLLDCTVAANGGGLPAVLNQGALVVLVGNTVLAANAGGDAVGAFQSLGFNAVGDSTGASGFSTALHDVIGTSGAPFNPRLGPLQDNGGPTLTLMPLSNSQLIDAGHSLAGELFDVRGHARKLDDLAAANVTGSDLTDIGDVEVGPPTHWPVLNLLDHGPGSLRQAALTAAPNDSVTFDPSVTGTIHLTSGEVFVPCSFSIYGPGPNALEIDGGGLRPVLSLPGPASVNIRGLHLTHGAVTAALDLATGAAISLDLMAITDSRTTGIRNGGSLTIARSLIAGCNAAAPPPNVESNGGGLLMVGTSTLYVINCTFAADTASNGGAISNPGGFVEVHNSTIVDNVTVGSTAGTRQGGGIHNAHFVTLESTIAAGNKAELGGPDLFGNYNSVGVNLVGIGDGSTGLSNGLKGDQVGTAAAPLDPKLGPLADNGGPTLTMLPLAGSPAIDQGNSSGYSTTEQRQRARVFDDPAVVNSGFSDGCDVGACERGAPTVDVAPPPAAGAAAVDRIDAVAPNPSRGAWTVRYTLARSGVTDLALFDVAGRRVATLAHGALAAGAHELAISAASSGARLSAGVYWLRLVTPASTTAQRLVRLE